MAEENPLENELDDELETQDDFDLEDSDDEIAGDDNQLELEGADATTSSSRFSNLINQLKTNRRYQFIAGGIGLVAIIVISFLIATPEKKEDALNPGMSQAEAPNFSSEEIVNKKSSKKKRKR